MCLLKFQKSHAICDLGKSITKRLATREEDLQGFVVSVPLPPMIYKPCQKEEENDSVVSYFLLKVPISLYRIVLRFGGWM